MKKSLIPGRFISIRGKVYRVKKQKTFPCEGCALNTILKCPNIKFENADNPEHLDCEINGVIFVDI